MLTIQDLQNKCEEILKTLPLAHYLKVKTIPVAFDNASQTSYFDPRQFRIVVAFNNIAMVIQSKQALPNNADLEKTIRCFLYHEVSHAIMTPTYLMQYAASSNSILTPQFANIIEDERIETLLKKYYLGVDFKENLRNAVPLDKHIKSFEHFVFNCVRHRCSPIMAEQVNRLVDRFILDTKDISASGDVYCLISKMTRLLEELKNIFDMLPKQKAQSNSSKGSGNGNESESNQNQESQSDNGTTEEENNDSSEEENENSQNENDQNEESDSSKEENDPTEEGESSDSDNSMEDSEESNGMSQEEAAENEQNQMEEDSESLNSEVDNKLSAEDIEKSIENQMLMNKQTAQDYGSYKMKLSDFSYEKDTKIAMLKIIGRNIGFGKKQNQAQFGYSGKFNDKRFATDFNDSCKWFKKRAYEETGLNNKKNNTKVLNIWLDNSGSYGKNDLDTNRILSALQSIEKSRDDFEFNLITFGDDFHEKSGEDRISCSTESTKITEKAIKLYKKYNPTGNELNIFLLDGPIEDIGNIDEKVKELTERIKNDVNLKKISQQECDRFLAKLANQAQWAKNRCNDSCYENLKSFNNKKVIFISEKDNESGLKRVCPQATLIIENNNYTGQLKRNILKAFDLLF